MAQTAAAQRQARAISLPKALRVTLAKVSDELFDLAAAVIAFKTERRQADALEGMFGEGALLMLLEGPNRKRAAAALDPALVGALVQQQTMGKVLPVPQQAQDRAPTATEAAICAPFIDALLSRAALLPEDPEEQQLLQGFSFGAKVEDERLLLMALGTAEFTVLRLTVDVEGGTRQGSLLLCFPNGIAAEDVESRSAPQTAETPPPKGLERQVLSLAADLQVSLTKMRMPLSAVRGFAKGDVLDLGVTAFDQAQVHTRDGRLLSRGVLGQINGVRALQLEHAPMAQRQPRRRASDRAELDLPKVTGDGTGTRPIDAAAAAPAESFAPPAVLEDAGLPDIGELTAQAPLPDLPDLPDLGDLPDMPDLPDMADLPGLDDFEDLTKVGTG